MVMVSTNPAGEPKKAKVTNSRAIIAVTIMVRAWKASVQATERIPAHQAAKPESPAMNSTPAM